MSHAADVVAASPLEIKPLVKSIHELSDTERAQVALASGKIAFDGPYSAAEYTGDNWWIPGVRPKTPDDRCISFSVDGGLSVSMCSNVYTFRVLSFLYRGVVLVLLWLALWTLLPSHLMERGGYVFDPMLTILLAAMIGTSTCRFFGIPAIVGCFWVGIIWNNIPTVGYFTDGIVPEVRTVSSLLGLSVILTRAGLSVNINQVRALLANVVAFSILPFMVEATLHAVLAKTLFEHPNWTWAFLQGFAASAVAPGVVVPPVLSLQQRGFGKTRGPNLLLLSSVVQDLIIGTWGVTFLVGLLFDKDRDLGLAIAIGPLQIIVGIIAGGICGCSYYAIGRWVLPNEASKIVGAVHVPKLTSRSHFLVAVTVLIGALMMIGVGFSLGATGGGAFAVMIAGATSGNLWAKTGGPSMATKKEVGVIFADLWDMVVMPALFAMAGSNVVLADLFAWSFLWRSFLCLALGMFGRFLFSGVCSFGLQFTKKEMVYLGLAWLGKGAAQGAVGGLAYTRAKENLDASSNSTLAERATLEEEVRSATVVRDTAALSILVGAPLAAIAIVKLGPLLLENEDEASRCSDPVDDGENEMEECDDPVESEPSFTAAVGNFSTDSHPINP